MILINIIKHKSNRFPSYADAVLCRLVKAGRRCTYGHNPGSLGTRGAGRGRLRSRIMSPDLQSLVVAAAMAIGAGVAVTLVLLVAVAVLLLWLFELSVTVCSSLTE